jgi:hypothetical protein
MGALEYYVGLDLGQAADYTAIAVLERTDGADGARARYALRHLERTRERPYPEIVARVVALLGEPALAGATLIVDATGVGAPVVDELRRAGVRPVAVTITGGDTVTHEGQAYRVPKRDLVSAVLMLLQQERLQVSAALPLADTLVRELLAFRVRINVRTGHDSYEAWREREHDDLVLSACLAAWYAEHQRPGPGIWW